MAKKKVLNDIFSPEMRESIITTLYELNTGWFEGAKNYDLVEILHDIYMDGFVGYKEMTDRELLKQMKSWDDGDDEEATEYHKLLKEAEGHAAVHDMLTSKPKKKNKR